MISETTRPSKANPHLVFALSYWHRLLAYTSFSSTSSSCPFLLDSGASSNASSKATQMFSSSSIGFGHFAAVRRTPPSLSTSLFG